MVVRGNGDHDALSNAPSLEPEPTVTGVPVALTPAASPSIALCGTVSGGDARKAAADQLTG